MHRFAAVTLVKVSGVGGVSFDELALLLQMCGHEEKLRSLVELEVLTGLEDAATEYHGAARTPC